MVSKLLFFTLYGEGEPVLRSPERFTIYLKGPFMPIDKLAERCGIDVVRVGDSYYVKNRERSRRRARRRLDAWGSASSPRRP
ncbi:hypothetical protein P186_0032 [Pyrobaculum ferrireducens]|uniref:Uncharacterized protein n=1 Tax=Pyrobaculum ferrireducens TaxID=1104324 RepID=G7VDS0_9CREN|nr:hypothetical protein P186_0032 [Pyrobaculum ferrireducens]